MDGQADVDRGVAGRSARREAERARKQRELAVPRRARFVSLLLGPSSQERRLLEREHNWSTGARGEEMLAELLERRCPSVLFLHDRRMPRTRANIDHLAVGPSGVYVIDAKRHRGRIEVRKPLLGEATLRIGGYDRTSMPDGLARQVAAVRAVVPAVPVHGCLCFVAPGSIFGGSGLPALRTLVIDEVPLCRPRSLARRLNREGSIGRQEVGQTHTALAAAFPAA